MSLDLDLIDPSNRSMRKPKIRHRIFLLKQLFCSYAGRAFESTLNTLQQNYCCYTIFVYILIFFIEDKSLLKIDFLLLSYLTFVEYHYMKEKYFSIIYLL